MRRAALIFNPRAGRNHNGRLHALERAASVLLNRGIEAEIIPTQGPQTAGQQALEAVNLGADVVFACGGDGTLHEVIQGLAHHPSAIVGVIPLGSANALARHLGLSFNPAAALRQQLRFTPQSVPLGRITASSAEGQQTRFFIAMAGAGPDGMLVYRMLGQSKRLFGRWFYYVRAARLFLGGHFPRFEIRVTLPDGATLIEEAVSAMAIRIGDLGGLFSPLVRGASPADETLLLTLTRPPHQLTLPAWFASSWTRTHRWNPYTQQLRVRSFTCNGTAARVHVQADGEWIGTTPMHVELVPNALRLLMPASASRT